MPNWTSRRVSSLKGKTLVFIRLSFTIAKSLPMCPPSTIPSRLQGYSALLPRPDLARVSPNWRKIILEEVGGFAERGPSEEELLREKAKQEFDFVNGLGTIGRVWWQS
jgi:hypothetical protein